MELLSLLMPLIVLAIIITFLLFKQEPSPPLKPGDRTAFLKSYPVVGSLPYFIKNHSRIVEWVTEILATSPAGAVAVPPIVFTSNPSDIEHIAKSHPEHYQKSEEVNAKLHDFLGDGLINVNGDKWRTQRKMASNGFSAKSLRGFLVDEVSREIADRLVPLLASASRSGDVLDLEDVFERFTFDTICSFVLGTDPDCLCGGSKEGEKFFTAFGEASHLVVRRAMIPVPLIWKLQRLLNVGSEGRLKDSSEYVREFIDRLIQSRRSRSAAARDGGRDDLFSQFATSLRRGDDDELLCDMLINLVVAGRDTMPSALTWFFWILSSRPDVVERIREEIESVRLGRRRHGISTRFTLEQLREMNYLHAALSESLRLYPPGWLIPRACLRDDVLPGGAEVKKGWTVMYCAYAMARTESIWGADCAEYRPERWLGPEGGFRAKDPFRYPVFHAGPRACVGKEMAYVQMKALVVSILDRFEVEVVEQRGKYGLSMTMKLEGGLPVKLRERKSKPATVGEYLA